MLLLAVKGPATVTAQLAEMGALAVMGADVAKVVAALKVDAALTVRLSVLSVPRTVLPLAVKVPATVRVLPAETAA